MDANQLNDFRTQQESRLLGARVQRVVCVVQGLILELQGTGRRFELGLLGSRDLARAYCIEDGRRDEVHSNLREDASLVAPFSNPPARWPRDASALDALRAWLLRPAMQPPEWMQLEGTHLAGLQTRQHDRRLWLRFETRDERHRSAGLVLVAELFDRGANFILFNDADEQIANWKGRRPAPETRADAATAVDAGHRATASARSSDATEKAWGVAPTLRHLAAASALELRSAHTRAQRRHERRIRTRLKKLEADARRADEAQAWRRMGEALIANLQHVRRGQQRVTLENPYAPGETLEVELDPALSPQENATLLFKRARRGERGRETIAARLTEAQRELANVTDVSAPPTDAPNWPDVLDGAHATWKASLSAALVRADVVTLWSPGGPRWERPPDKLEPSQRTKRDEGPGRCFTLPGSWEVRVGRSNAENDELTHRFAHPDDVWLHASGVPGSHVVLRMKGLRDNPPRDVLEAAAAIAARFSRAKHARTVPVVWTRKRYVRKPRKSKPGLATCTNEKTVFVRPGLPEGNGDSEA